MFRIFNAHDNDDFSGNNSDDLNKKKTLPIVKNIKNKKCVW